MEYFYLNLFELKQTKIYIFKKKFIINNGIYSDMYCNIEIIWSNILINLFGNKNEGKLNDIIIKSL